MLERIDGSRGRLGAIDIAAEGFDASRYGRDWETLMGRIHGVLPDGSIVEGVEVFRRVYAAVGRGWMLSWTRLPPFARPVDAAYRWFARNRLRLTGREAECPANPELVEP
jgi:predicted DCC family thiol-disulfide oxidoreductase YuxK